MKVEEVVRYFTGIDSHLSTGVELDTKILEEIIVPNARNGLVVDVISWFSDINDGKVLHTESKV